MSDRPKKEKAPKIRASEYDKPLKIHGTFDQAIKALVNAPKSPSKPKDKKA